MFDDRYNGLTLDEAAEKAGGYVAYRPNEPLIMDYDYHAISNYCRKNGVNHADLTEEELKQFAFEPPLVYPRSAAANRA